MILTQQIPTQICSRLFRDETEVCAPLGGIERWLPWLQVMDVVQKKMSKASGLIQGDADEVMRCMDLAMLLFLPLL